MDKEMILSTCNSVDGYKAVQQYGLVFGEVLFKANFFKRLGAAVDDLTDTFTFGDKEMSGTSALIENARRYAMDKMKKSAAARGANAIIGIDAESSVGGDLMHITIYGTAVRLESEEEIRIKEEERKQQEEKERKRQEEYQREQAIRKQETDERVENYFNSLENDQSFSFSVNEKDRQRLIDSISYAVNMAFISKTRTRLKQINTESGQEIIEFLLSLPDDDLKPVAQRILSQLKGETP